VLANVIVKVGKAEQNARLDLRVQKTVDK